MADGSADNRRRLEVFVILFVVWGIFSGHYDARHLGLGVVCAALVAAFSYDLLLPDAAPTRLLTAWRFLGYIPWLLWEVILANLHVIYLIVRPAEIRPQIVRFKTSLRADLAKVALGNSITLTPGTVTMDIVDDEFFVHALSDKTAQDLKSGTMERRVAHVFLETAPAADAAGRRER